MVLLWGVTTLISGVTGDGDTAGDGRGETAGRGVVTGPGAIDR